MIPAAATLRAPSRAPTDHLPVLLVTGFLGSIKTTLSNPILSNRAGIRAAVLVNELRQIGIDLDEDPHQHRGPNRLVQISRDLDEADLRERLASCLAAS